MRQKDRNFNKYSINIKLNKFKNKFRTNQTVTMKK